MKYAFVSGSNAFVVPSKVVVYNDGQEDKEFLRINSIYNKAAPAAEDSSLDIDLNIKDTNGTPIILISNKPVTNLPYTIETEHNAVRVLKEDGSMVIQILQLDEESAMDLEHNIVAELEVNFPVVVIRITGRFMLGELLVRAENEKLLINDNGYATSALAGKNQLRFTTEGVVL